MRNRQKKMFIFHRRSEIILVDIVMTQKLHTHAECMVVNRGKTNDYVKKIVEKITDKIYLGKIGNNNAFQDAVE